VADLDASSPEPTVTDRDDVVLVKDPQGTLSVELMPLREGFARGFMRFSPRNFKLSDDSIRNLSDAMSSRPYSTILVQDSRKRLLRKHLAKAGWRIERAILDTLTRQCSMITTYDLPFDENLIDSNGDKPDLSNTSDMRGISIDIGSRKAWAFYTDDGESARVVSEGERRQGMLVATNAEDMTEVADCLVRFLASTRKPWAVFSVDMGRFVRQFNPIMMIRMVCDRPKPFQHSGVPVSSSNKRTVTRLFSEYFDESMVQSMLRLRKYRMDPSFSVHHIDGGFVITKVEGDTGLIFDIYVTPAKQGEGLGAELMRCGLTSLAGRVSSVYLHTSYPRAKRLYEKFGFKAVYSQLGIRLDEIALHPPRPK
jgi:GNAT superfamily N-acetyltransferase